MKRWICEFSIWYGYELLLAILNTWMSADHCTYGSCQSSSILRIPTLSFFLVQVNFIASHCHVREVVYKSYTHMFPSLHYILHLTSRVLLFLPFVIFDASLAGLAGIIPYSSVVATHRDSRKLELVAASHLSQTRFSLFGPLLIFTLNLQHGFIPGPQQCLPLQEGQTYRAPTGFM